ncbi:MAG: 2Fe-2S iron-sulfur cluster binding domain-containing protein [Nannocystis sp.]|nr:2Fe-2S iron-sulfur cluster binding domain-containing protein [Nannocystis sp.]
MPKIRFIEPDRILEVEAKAGDTLLEVAEEHGVKMGSACGGVCACSACHCWIRAGLPSLPEAEDAESDRLDMAFDVRPFSRLGCQVRVGTADLTVELTQESITTWFNEHPDQR